MPETPKFDLQRALAEREKEEESDKAKQKIIYFLCRLPLVAASIHFIDKSYGFVGKFGPTAPTYLWRGLGTSITFSCMALICFVIGYGLELFGLMFLLFAFLGLQGQ